MPVIAKEVGNGISVPMVKRLREAGIAAVDVAGAGGTSWAKVESERATDPVQRRLGQTFADWGIPTADCIVAARQVDPAFPLIASGGLRNGLDIAKNSGPWGQPGWAGVSVPESCQSIGRRRRGPGGCATGRIENRDVLYRAKDGGEIAATGGAGAGWVKGKDELVFTYHIS